MPSRRFELQRGALRLAAWVLALPGAFALLLLMAGSSLAAAPCHDAPPHAAAAHGVMHGPAGQPVANPAMMDAAPAMAGGLPCTSHAPGAPCCAASCTGGGWVISPPPLCPAPAGALLASGHALHPAGGPGAPVPPDLPPPRRA